MGGSELSHNRPYRAAARVRVGKERHATQKALFQLAVDE